MGGAPEGQQQLALAQSNYYTTLTNESTQEFDQAQAISTELTNTFGPIFAAGPNQEGFNAAEVNNLNSAAATDTGQAYQAVAQAEGTQEAGEGGGNEFVPQGANRQLNTEVATAEAQQLSTEQNQIVQENYAVGLQNFDTAAQGMETALNPYSASTGAAQVADSGGAAAGQTWSAIASEDNSWMSVLSAGLTAAGTAASGTPSHA
jgi:hypothetical protein